MSAIWSRAPERHHLKTRKEQDDENSHRILGKGTDILGYALVGIIDIGMKAANLVIRAVAKIFVQEMMR
jgi:hypothetical protein